MQKLANISRQKFEIIKNSTIDLYGLSYAVYKWSF